MAKLSQRIKELRNEQNLTQFELSQILETSKSSINMYERGEREPGIEMLEAIADHFNVDMDYLFGRSEIRNRYNLSFTNENNTDSSLSEKEEKEHIKKYHTLDEHGKDIVDTIMDKEIERINKYEKAESVEKPKHKITIAAYGGNGVEIKEITDEQREKAREEYRKLKAELQDF